MTTILMTSKGDICFDNIGVQPIEVCPRCGWKELQHNYTAGVMSDEYSDSSCERCGMKVGYVMGGWMYLFIFNYRFTTYKVTWWTTPLIKMMGIEPVEICCITNDKDNDNDLTLPLLPFDAKISEIVKLWKDNYDLKNPPRVIDPNEMPFPEYEETK